MTKQVCISCGGNGLIWSLFVCEDCADTGWAIDFKGFVKEVANVAADSDVENNLCSWGGKGHS
jgi:hypothetical protein